MNFNANINPVTCQRSYSFLTRQNTEEWKVSQNNTPSSTISRIQKRKPLPAVPTAVSLFQPQNIDNNYYTMPDPILQNSHYSFCQPLIVNNNAVVEPQPLDYTTTTTTPTMFPNDTIDLDHSVIEEQPVSQEMDSSATIKKSDKSIRQIRVKSINNDYLVWISVEPKETGESLAEKVHTIATFSTRKIISVTTASGRNIPLNKSPVFRNWEDLEEFEDGEIWSVTWGPLKKSMMDKILSKFIET
ncbi:uncharacterized protein BX663DRAFT_510265 [Cokeromyces recurvatus]|uniref:uncharacterized protein n=1 Tax=Cokeromyces recurvatus TaxID=90255 RepID=UPI00221E7CD6|nr:uncharacterized protein BX663DRAFT_510265 [Cokeromyces recurvatus]KAI7902726.1 hypothetical protein BX663DRAFT_510265 [Cokeromyces recurvatus]